MTDSVMVLKRLADSHRLRVRKRVAVYLDPSDAAMASVTVVHSGRRVEVMVSPKRLILTSKAEVPVFLSVGTPGRMLLTDRRVDAHSTGLVAYASRGFEQAVTNWLQSPARLRALKRLRLRDGESLHIARNETMLVRHLDVPIDRALDTLGAVLDIISTARQSPAQCSRSLPNGFEDLEQIVPRWVISDDAERERAIQDATTDVRAKLSALLLPRLKDIDEYLATLDPHLRLSDEAIRLQALGELGAELALEQKR